MSLHTGLPTPLREPITINPGTDIPEDLGFVDLNVSPSVLPSIGETPLANGAFLYARNLTGDPITINATGPDTIDGSASLVLPSPYTATLFVDYKTGIWRLFDLCFLTQYD